jgi:predicted enzyme related to lactoylglutathione lyase
MVVFFVPVRRRSLLRIVDMTDRAHSHHGIDYIEFSVTDVAVAKAFYGAAFGWTFTDYGPNYCGIKGDRSEVGGFRKVEVVRQGGPLVVLYSTDLDASLRAVSQAGGKIIKEPFGFPAGRRFEFADPSGNALAVWTPA